MKRRKRRPTDAEVADYWLIHDSANEIDWRAVGVRFEFDPDVERPTRPVTLRLPRRLLQELRVLAKGLELRLPKIELKLSVPSWQRF